MKSLGKSKLINFIFIFTLLILIFNSSYFSKVLAHKAVVREVSLQYSTEKILDEGIIKSYEDKGIWCTYGRYFIIGGLVIIIEAILIFTLISNRRKRKNAESELVLLNNSLEKLVYDRTKELNIAKSNLEELNRELDFSSRIDVLTGLYNRRHMEERLNEEYQVFLRSGQAFSIMIADIDDFKQVNDNYGHDVGDRVLKTLSNTLRNSIREYDVIARWGGEEFLLLFPKLEGLASMQRAEVIRQAVENDIHIYNDDVLNITITIGLAIIEKDETIEELIKRADNALYEGKNAGKNKVVLGQ